MPKPWQTSICTKEPQNHSFKQKDTKIFHSRVHPSHEIQTRNLFPFVASKKALRRSESQTKFSSRDKFDLIFSKRMQSAYVNTVNEDEASERDNVYCINNKDMSNASKIRLIKKIEKQKVIEEEKEPGSMEKIRVRPKKSETQASEKDSRTMGDSSGSIFKDLHTRFAKSMSLNSNVR